MQEWSRKIINENRSRMRNNKQRLFNNGLKHIAKERRRDHQFIKRTMKRRVVKVRYRLVPIAANLLVGMRGQDIMKKMTGGDADGKHQQEHNGDNFLYDAFFSQCKGLPGSEKVTGDRTEKGRGGAERFGKFGLTIGKRS